MPYCRACQVLFILNKGQKFRLPPERGESRCWQSFSTRDQCKAMVLIFSGQLANCQRLRLFWRGDSTNARFNILSLAALTPPESFSIVLVIIIKDTAVCGGGCSFSPRQARILPTSWWMLLPIGLPLIRLYARDPQTRIEIIAPHGSGYKFTLVAHLASVRINKIPTDERNSQRK